MTTIAAQNQSLCRNYLGIVDQTPHSNSMPWMVIHVGGYVLIVDYRDECSTPAMEAVAERFGEIVATDSIPSRKDAGSLFGCLIQIEGGDIDEIAGMVRDAYATATNDLKEGRPG